MIARAPRWSRWLTNEPARSAGRVTRMVRPSSVRAVRLRALTRPGAPRGWRRRRASSSSLATIRAALSRVLGLGRRADRTGRRRARRRRPRGGSCRPSRPRSRPGGARSRRRARASARARRRGRAPRVGGPAWSARARTTRSSARHCTARHPCPGAGTISSTPSVRACVGIEPEALEPGRRQDGDVHLAVVELAQARVHVAAELGDAHARVRRQELRPTADRGRPDDHPLLQHGRSRNTRTSWGSARSGTAPIARSSSSSAGRSFAECTARSISPSRSASTIVSIQRPFIVSGDGSRSTCVGPARPRRPRSSSGRARRRRPGAGASAAPARPARWPAATGASRSGAFSPRVVEVDAEQLGQEPGVRAVGAGLRALLQLHDRIVQELGGHAARERLDRLVLVRREVGEPARPPGRAPPGRSSSPRCAERADQGTELIAAATDDPATDLLASRARGPARCRRRSARRGPRSAPRIDTMSITRTPVDVGDLGVDVARDGEVEQDERATRRAAHRAGDGGVVDHVAGSPGRRHHQVGVGQGGREQIEIARGRSRCARRGPGRARTERFTTRDRADAGAPQVLRRRARPSGRRRSRRRSGPPARPAPRRPGSAPSATNASGAAPSAVSWRTRRPARIAAWNRPVSAEPAMTRGPRGPHGLADLRRDLRLAEDHRVQPGRHREQVLGGVLLPVRVQRLGELVQVDAARTPPAAASATGTRRGTRRRCRRPRPGCRWTGSTASSTPSSSSTRR